MPRQISKKGLKKKLDKAWSDVVKLQAGNKCEVCGLKHERLNAHHIVGRRNMRLRYELFNGVSLCPGCHTFRTKSAHQDPEWFHEWLEENRGEDLKLISATREEIQKWTVDDMKLRLEELNNLLNN